jgi:hydrogenase nickel incorporation protein HypA/HybF
VHEVGIARSVIETVTARLPGATITGISLEVGSLSGVVPESFRYGFEAAAAGTPLEGVRLDITERQARCRCDTCGQEFQPGEAVPLCPCGSADVTVLSGEDLRITSVQVAEPPG